MNRTKTLLAALALALPVGIAGCGGDDESEPSSDDRSPEEILEAAFNNETKIESGVADLSFDVSAEGESGGSVTATISGPFAADPENPEQVGQLDWDITISGEGAVAEGLPQDIEAGITITEDNAYVAYDGTDYELGPDAFEQIQAQQEEAAGDSEGLSFTQQCEDAITQAGGDAAACDIDFSTWFTELENEGVEDVGGADTNHIAGTMDISQVVTDVIALVQAVPEASGDVGSQLEVFQSTIENALTDPTFDLYAATEDDTIRGLDFSLGLDTASLGTAAAGIESAALDFSLEISGVGEEQTFEAPADPQPIEDLQQDLGGLGVSPGAPELPGATGGGGGSLDPDCISEAAGDPAEIEKCLEK